MRIASLTPLVDQCESRSTNFTLFQSGWWPFLLACSETVQVWVRTKRVSLVFFHPLWHRSSRFTNVDFAAFTRNPVNHALLSGWIYSFLWSYQMRSKCRVELEDCANTLLLWATAKRLWCIFYIGENRCGLELRHRLFTWG